MMSMFYVVISSSLYPFNCLKLYIMLSLCLGFPVALSDAKDWTPVKKGIALIWIAMLDTLIIGLCCW